MIKKTLLFLILSSILGSILLILSYAIPTRAIYKNAAEGAGVFLEEGMYKQLITGYSSSQLDNFTDAIIMGEIIYKGNETMVKKAMKIYRKAKENPMDDFIKTVNGDSLENESYERYWHGNIALFRPLFLFFSYSNLRVINLLVQFLLFSGIILLMYENHLRKYILPFITAIFLLFPFVIGFSLQFSPVYYVTLISILLLLKYKSWFIKKNRYLYLFLFIGILTSYLDLLTFPVLTLGMPLLFYLLLSKENVKSQFLDIIKISTMWILGYFGMWILKWMIGSILCGENFFGMAIDRAKYRIGTDSSRIEAIVKNILVYRKKPFALIFLGIFIYYTVIFIKNKIKITKQKILEILPYMLVMIFPLVWYFVINEHSLIHFWFTSKSLAVSFLAFFISLAHLSTRTLKK